MSKIEELIKELCPNGVEYKKLGELGIFLGGLSGKTRNDFIDGNAKFITYKNVYSNPSLILDVVDRVKITYNEKQNTLKYGDIIFTGSSETPDECGFSSVVTTQIEEKIYLNSFCFIFRFNDLSLMMPDFAKHLFRSESLRYQIGKTASGVTRYNVSKEKMKQVQIPLPPLAVQREIVQILDKFTLLSAELKAELIVRRNQFEYYREKLQSQNCDMKTYTVKEFCKDMFWIMPSTPKYTDSGISYITSKNIKNGAISLNGARFISLSDYEKISSNRPIYENDILISMIGTLGEIAVVKKTDLPLYGQNMYLLRLNNEIINLRYFYYLFNNDNIKTKLNELKNNSNQGYLKAEHIYELKFDLPSIEVQERIVNILDNFDAICSDTVIGLPAEIEARQKQYEHYRDKLLKF